MDLLQNYIAAELCKGFNLKSFYKHSEVNMQALIIPRTQLVFDVAKNPTLRSIQFIQTLSVLLSAFYSGRFILCL